METNIHMKKELRVVKREFKLANRPKQASLRALYSMLQTINRKPLLTRLQEVHQSHNLHHKTITSHKLTREELLRRVMAV